jgi:hypothetical protein
MNILIDDQRTHCPDGTVPDIILRNARAATNILVVSDNPAGRKRMEQVIEKLYSQQPPRDAYKAARGALRRKPSEVSPEEFIRGVRDDV